MNKGRRTILKEKSIPFSQRLFWSIFFMFLGFSGCMLIFQYQRESEFTQEKLDAVLKSYNYELHSKIQHAGSVQQIDSIVNSFLEEIPQKDIRFTIIGPEGNVLFDNSGNDIQTNHNNRSEVLKARHQEKSFTIRSSETTGIRYFYSALDINRYIYRAAIPYEPYAKGELSINKDFIYFMCVMTLIFLFVLSRFTLSIGETISKLRDFARNIRDVKSGNEEYNFPNDELGDISKQIITLYNKLQKAKDDLAIEREKIIKHFQYAREGVAMFTDNDKEILSNILYIQFANLISDTEIRLPEEVIDLPEMAPVKSFLENNHDAELKRILRKAITIDKGGKTFLVECLLFLNKSYEISINDISRQEEESRMKRQLTQNIAHELKTPVSSIQGYLETIITNPALPEDKKSFFIERCYSQSTRLTGLLQDISVLNRLDEAGTLYDLSNVNIYQLVHDIQKECLQKLEEKAMNCSIKIPKDATIEGNHSLLYSIFRNLFDNAIAYAGNNTHITVNCYKEDSEFYYFSFSDNGIGVEEGHINRIFERFYRVDKGRSRKLGGTGLGLSIVKNGVLFHKGQISAKSTPGKGLQFFFTLKRKLA